MGFEPVTIQPQGLAPQQAQVQYIDSRDVQIEALAQPQAFTQPQGLAPQQMPAQLQASTLPQRARLVPKAYTGQTFEQPPGATQQPMQLPVRTQPQAVLQPNTYVAQPQPCVQPQAYTQPQATLQQPTYQAFSQPQTMQARMPSVYTQPQVVAQPQMTQPQTFPQRQVIGQPPSALYSGLVLK